MPLGESAVVLPSTDGLNTSLFVQSELDLAVPNLVASPGKREMATMYAIGLTRIRRECPSSSEPHLRSAAYDRARGA